MLLRITMGKSTATHFYFWECLIGTQRVLEEGKQALGTAFHIFALFNGSLAVCLLQKFASDWEQTMWKKLFEGQRPCSKPASNLSSPFFLQLSVTLCSDCANVFSKWCCAVSKGVVYNYRSTWNSSKLFAFQSSIEFEFVSLVGTPLVSYFTVKRRRILPRRRSCTLLCLCQLLSAVDSFAYSAFGN